MLFTFSMRAPEFPLSEWLNTDQPLNISGLKGHVVVLDFWTYCCINCIHIQPDLKYIEETFKEDPVVVIGVHSAKFVNEKDTDNIRSAVARYQITHPVVIDNDHKIWDTYAVRAWPTFVVIDAEGKIRAHFSGEGHRQDLEQMVTQLLKEGRKNHVLTKSPIKIPAPPNDFERTLAFPGKIAFSDDFEDLFISDSNHNRILHCHMSAPNKAELLQIIGTGEAGWKDGSLSDAQFRQPQGLAFYNRKLLVCDTENHLLRQIDLEKGTVETLAGTGQQAAWGATGGPARTSPLSSPWDIVTADHEIIIAMAGSHQIWRYLPEEERVEVLAGSGAENLVDGSFAKAQLAQPSGLTVSDGIVYVADSEVSAIRKLRLHDQTVSTIVGHGLFTFGLTDGALEDGLLQHPLGVAVTEHYLFVADTYNHAIRQIDLQEGDISTIIKRQRKTVCMIGDKDCGQLPLNEPNDVKVNGQYLYIADTNNHLIRVYDRVEQELSDLEITGW